MKRIVPVCFILFYFGKNALAQQLQPLKPALEALKPDDVFTADPQNTFVFIDKAKQEKPATFSSRNGDKYSPIFIAEVFAAAKNGGDIQCVWKNEKPIKKDDVMLARFMIHSIYAKQESGEAVIGFYVQQNIPPNERQVIIETSIGPEWKSIDIPFEANGNMEPGQASIGISFGALPQKVEMANVQLLNFQQKTSLATLPTTRFSYSGREADAAWRTAALKRIAEIRTAPLVINVTDANGKPVKNAVVNASLVQPDFIFGTAVSVDLINNTDSNGTMYKKRLKELFNTVTIDNNLKWPAWINAAKREQTKMAISWINSNGLRLRGHNLVWPGKKFTPSFYAKQPGFGPGFADSISNHIQDIVASTKGKVIAWDVINEMMHEKDYFEVMPRTKAVEWFQQAHRIDPNAQLFINEYSMLNSIASPQNIATYLDLIAELRNGGAPIQAIGVQGHVGRQPRNPAQVLTDLDMFKTTGLPVQITEFDVNTPDEALQADYTRDFLIACYSHPMVTGFTMWGFWEAAHWKPDAAMFKKDWTAKPNAAVWQDLVTKQWRTNITQQTDANGKIIARGHLGKYEITITDGNKVVKSFYQLTKNGLPDTIKM